MSPVILNRSEHRKDRKIFNDVLPKLAAQVVHKARLHAHVAYSQLRNRHAGDIKTCRHRSGDDRNASVYGQVPFPFWALQGENAHVLPNGERHQAPHIEINKLIGSLFREVVVWPIPLLHHLMRLPGQQQCEARHNREQISNRNDEEPSLVLSDVTLRLVLNFLNLVNHLSITSFY